MKSMPVLLDCGHAFEASFDGDLRGISSESLGGCGMGDEATLNMASYTCLVASTVRRGKIVRLAHKQICKHIFHRRPVM